MSTNKTCTNCPGATDHDTAHCPLTQLRERFRLNEELPPKWYALVLRELDAFIAELRGVCPEQAEGEQGEREDGQPLNILAQALKGEMSLITLSTPMRQLAFPADFVADFTDAPGVVVIRPRAALAQPSRPIGREPIEIVFDGPPGPESGRFVEVENMQGRSICAGQWIDRGDGYWALRIGALAQPSQAPGLCQHCFGHGLNDPAGSEPCPLCKAPEVVGYLLAKGNGTLSIIRAGSSDEPVMTIAQHAAIVAKWAELLNRANDRADAAQARVAELEKQEPVGYRARFLKEPEKWMSNWGMPVPANPNPAAEYQLLYAAPVAQAGQVPYVPKGEWSFKYLDNGNIVICNGSDWTVIEAGKGPIYEQFLYRFCESQMLAAAPAQGE